jgi:hypothetical protein
MKLTKILLTLLVTLSFSATANADRYKLKSCERAEMAFWDAIQKADSDQSFIESLGEKDQITYYNMAKGNIERTIAEVRKRCKGIASKDILDAYEKKKSEIESHLNAL